MSMLPILDHAELQNKKVLIRLDINVPLQNGAISDMTRIERILPNLKELSDKGARTVILSHLGRPKGEAKEEFSLKPVAVALTQALGQPIKFVDTTWRDDAVSKAITSAQPGDIILAENIRFHPGEEANDHEFADMLATLGEIYINDAFSCSHRSHASITGLAARLASFAGRSLEKELNALEAGLSNPTRPVAAVVGGSKISTKISILENLIPKVDYLIIGGAMANTFLAEQGYDIGKSLCEHDMLQTVTEINAAAKDGSCEVILPKDAVVAAELKADVATKVVSVDAIPADQMVLDVGPQSIEHINQVLAKAKTLVWNGPFGAFEFTPFDAATNAAAQFAAKQTKAGNLVSVAGGGDTVAALNHAGASADFTYISTAGGAFLEWLEGKPLPGVDALMKD